MEAVRHTNGTKSLKIFGDLKYLVTFSFDPWGSHATTVRLIRYGCYKILILKIEDFFEVLVHFYSQKIYSKVGNQNYKRHKTIILYLKFIK